MLTALSHVPDDWEKPGYKAIRLGRSLIRHPLFQRTFDALKRRGLVEWRGGPGTWQWRKRPDCAGTGQRKEKTDD